MVQRQGSKQELGHPTCFPTFLFLATCNILCLRCPAPCRQDQKEGRDASELLSADLARLAPLTNALFFGLVGASLKLRGEAGGAGRRQNVRQQALTTSAALSQPTLPPLPPIATHAAG